MLALSPTLLLPLPHLSTGKEGPKLVDFPYGRTIFQFILINIFREDFKMNLYYEFIHPSPFESDQLELPSLPLASPPKNQKNQAAPGRSCSRKLNAKSRKARYNWNSVQNKRYINFLVKRRELFDLSNEQRKCMKINVIMSSAIPSRTAAQCHCHHQKMMLKYGTIEGVIKAHKHLLQTKYISKRSTALLSAIFNQDKQEQESVQLNLISEEEQNDRECSPFRLGIAESRFSYDGTFIDFNLC